MNILKAGNANIELIVGDITAESLDCIVNAANSSLRGGGGVDGAIHRAGGPAIMAECRRLQGCPTGEAVITNAGKLRCGKVIHTVGPIYRGGNRRDEKLLASCYVNSLKLASEHGIKTIAFPSISTGAYSYPVNEAAKVALRAVASFLNENDSIKLVRFVLFDTVTYDIYSSVLNEMKVKNAR